MPSPGSRPFRVATDVGLLVDFVVDATASRWPHVYWHVGDLLWGLYRSAEFDAERNIRLWLDDQNRVRAFAWFYPPRAVAMQIDSAADGDDSLEDAMLTWAERHQLTYPQGESPSTLVSTAFERDGQRIAVLERHGFTRGDTYLLHMRRSLAEAIPPAVLPVGGTVRAVDAGRDLEERVALHREVWHPSSVTLESYRRLRAAPGYIPDLDLIAVTPDGTLAAYCICWLDAVNGVGEFEPVGTRAAYRRQGLGLAVVCEGLRRLRERGATSAIVLSVGSNEGARKLYEAAGFNAVAREYDYVKRLS